MENETRDETLRLQDQSLRAFDVEVLLTKHLTLPDTFNAGFTKEDGTSLIKLASNIRGRYRERHVSRRSKQPERDGADPDAS